MKIIISESQRNYILSLYEQPDSKFDRLGIALTSKNDNDYVQRMREYEKYNLLTKNISVEELLDNLVDIIAALLDGIPGIGNLASSGVDIAHSLSFFVRSYFSDDTKKFENIINGITTGFMAAIPLAGNVVNMGIRNTIKRFLDMTHGDVVVWLKQNGINIGGSFFPLNKNRFVYAYLAALISYTKGEIAERLSSITNYATKVESKLKLLIDKLNSVKNLPYVKIFIDAIQYVKDLFVELKTLIGYFIL